MSKTRKVLKLFGYVVAEFTVTTYRIGSAVAAPGPLSRLAWSAPPGPGEPGVARAGGCEAAGVGVGAERPTVPAEGGGR